MNLECSFNRSYNQLKLIIFEAISIFKRRSLYVYFPKTFFERSFFMLFVY